MVQTLQEFITELKGAPKRVADNVTSVMYAEAVAILDEFKQSSPIDSGDFKHAWKLSTVRSQSADNIIRYRFSNSVPYGVYLDEGAVPGGAPWYWPNAGTGGYAKRSRGKTSASGKLVSMNSRIWAGGKSPAGHVVGGIIDPILYRNEIRIKALAAMVAKAVMDSI